VTTKVLGNVFEQRAGDRQSHVSFDPVRMTLGRTLWDESKSAEPQWQRKFDWQPQPIFWQFEASENNYRRAIITINEPEFHSFAGQDWRRSTMRFREGALWQTIGRWQRGEVSWV
jgi:hypothetical protein